MSGRCLLAIAMAVAMFGWGCGQTPRPVAKPQADPSAAAPRFAAESPSAQAVAANQHTVAKPISSSGSSERVLFSPATPEATHGLPLDHSFSDVPKVPSELMGPSPPIKGE